MDRHLERLGQKINKKIDMIGKLSTNVMLINCYDNIGLTREETESILCRDEYILCYHEFYNDKMAKAYEPFLDWIKEAYEKYLDISLDEFMDACGIYKLHRTIIKSYFETGIGKRDEILYIDSIGYEVQKMYEDIISMISYISKHKPVVFVFNKLQFSGISTMELLNCFFENDKTNQIVLLATFNSESAVLNVKQKEWKHLVDKFSDIKCIYDWDKFGDEHIIAECESDGQYFELSEEYISEKVCDIHNMCKFLALPQAYYNIKNLYRKCEKQQVEISLDLKFTIYKMYIKTCAETNRVAKGFEAMDSLKQLVNNAEKKFDYYVMQAFLEIANGQFDDARATVSKARELVFDNQKNKDILDIVDYIADMQYWNKDWKESNLKDDELYIIDICKRLNYKNLLARVYITGFENNSELYDRVEGIEDRLVYFNKGNEIAGEMGDYWLQLLASYKPLMIATNFGYTEVMNYFYKEKCIPLARKCGYLKEEAYSYTGLGYNCMTCEGFDEANEYFNKALLIHYKFNDIEAMMEVLYNMTMNAIMIEDYRSADRYVSTCIYAIENLRKDGKISVFHISKLYGYKALVCYYLDDLYKSKIYLGYEKRLLDYILESDDEIDNFELWYDELFVYHYVKGLIYTKDELYENAKEYLEKALFYSEMADTLKFFTYTRCQIELSKIYMIFEKKIEAVDCLEKAVAYTNKSGLKKQEAKLKQLLKDIEKGDIITEGDYVENLIEKENISEQDLSQVTIEEVHERIKNIGILNRSKEEKERIEFLSGWSKIINKTVDSTEDMISNVLNTFCNNFQIENLLFIDINDESLSVMYKKLDVDIDDSQLMSIYEYAKHNPNEFAASRMDEFFYDYTEIMSVFNLSKISSFMYIPILEKVKVKYIVIMYMNMQNIWGTNLNMFMLNNDLLFLFSSSIHQLTDEIERERIHLEICSMNDKLSYVALMDNLTGLYNRQGLQNNLDKKFEEPDTLTAVLYIDLDNFKYYNDNFGHDIGDLVLVSFANIIKNICKEKGVGVRYGGDEFLIIMNLDKYEEATEIATSIFDTLYNDKSFIPLVEKTLGRKVEISDDKRVSCSVGISFLDKKYGDKAFGIALKQADDALYYIKRNGKGRYEVWRPEKEY